MSIAFLIVAPKESLLWDSSDGVSVHAGRREDMLGACYVFGVGHSPVKHPSTSAF